MKWEFPGGKVEPGESAPQALKREIAEELRISVEVRQSLGTFATPLGNYLIRLECYWCLSEDRHVTLTSHSESGWFNPNELQFLDWALPDVPVLEVILRTYADDQASGII